MKEFIQSIIEMTDGKVDNFRVVNADGTYDFFGREVTTKSECNCKQHQETIDELQKLIDTYRAALFGLKGSERELADARFVLHAEFEFPENLHLGDVIEKYVMRQLEDFKKTDWAKGGLSKEVMCGSSSPTVHFTESPNPSPNEVVK